MVSALAVFGPLERSERSVADENVRFALPREVRGPSDVSGLPDSVRTRGAEGMV